VRYDYEIHKSILLAKLMGWGLTPREQGICIGRDGHTEQLCPYADSVLGRAQFAAIVLAFPDVHRTTQEDTLNEILKLHHN